jgi:hypothetical protein
VRRALLLAFVFGLRALRDSGEILRLRVPTGIAQTRFRQRMSGRFAQNDEVGRKAAELSPLKQPPLSIEVSGYRQQALLHRGQVLIEGSKQCRVRGVFRHQIN